MTTSTVLEKRAQELGGARTYDFSQAAAFKVAAPDGVVEKMYRMVLRNGQPMGGLCATICAFWVAFHAKQGAGILAHAFTRDRSVWDYLFKDGGLQMGAAQNITVEYHLSTGDQLVYLENFLKKFQVKRRLKRVGGSVISMIWTPLSGPSASGCADAITNVGGYKLIQLKKSLNGSGSGHMVSAWSDGSDVLFMDPNYGEFWFPNKKAFSSWLTYFFNKTYLLNGYKALRVHDFA